MKFFIFLLFILCSQQLHATYVNSEKVAALTQILSDDEKLLWQIRIALYEYCGCSIHRSEFLHAVSNLSLFQDPAYWSALAIATVNKTNLDVVRYAGREHNALNRRHRARAQLNSLVAQTGLTKYKPELEGTYHVPWSMVI